jgi:tRNA (guanine-N7-)-methyltransferase
MVPHPANSASTPAYAALIEQRRQEVRTELERILTRGSSFLWEVGSGHGHFLTAYAAAHPEKTCIGIDLASDRVERARRKRDRARLPNLHFLRAEARLFLQSLPPGAQISEVFILFPDPWPKLRHHKHRVLQPEFLTELAGHATADCRLYFRTDYRDYFAEARAVIIHSVHWRLLEAPWPFEFETVFQARAERHESFIAELRRGAP